MLEGVNSSMIYFLYYKDLYKFHSVPLPSTTIKNKKRIVGLRKKNGILYKQVNECMNE
jgi:hypothetical protein